ncbi:hypothetical protein G9A89_023116 [Geosiphon pyriformis]|nr:hypothetical protein G9A89_023116 [Geosiphon pyriformis]
MQPTTNNQSSFNPLTIISPGNGSIKGPTGDPDDDYSHRKFSFLTTTTTTTINFCRQICNRTKFYKSYLRYLWTILF